jgi:hypothetical protein
MHLALINLDTGLFFARDGWTHDVRLADTFMSQEILSRIAIEKNVKNAAAALVEGNPPRATGFLWISEPNQNGHP